MWCSIVRCYTTCLNIGNMLPWRIALQGSFLSCQFHPGYEGEQGCSRRIAPLSTVESLAPAIACESLLLWVLYESYTLDQLRVALSLAPGWLHSVPDWGAAAPRISTDFYILRQTPSPMQQLLLLRWFFVSCSPSWLSAARFYLPSTLLMFASASLVQLSRESILSRHV